jgi:hypothetical protein
MWSSFEEGSYLRRIDLCIRLKSNDEEEEDIPRLKSNGGEEEQGQRPASHY